MAKLTKDEIKWVKKVQAALNECPSRRIGFFTIGDSDVMLYDRTKIDAIYNHLDNNHCDFCISVSANGANFSESLTFPNCVDSTAG